MVTLSEKAQTKIKEIMKSGNKTGWGLRISVRNGGCSGFAYSMEFDENRTEHDQILDFNGFKVYVDSKSLIYLVGTEVDFSDGLNDSGFVFNNPNAKNSCGCGNSFAV